MQDLQKSIDQLSTQLSDALAAASNHDELERIRVAFLGRQGLIPTFLEQLKTMSLEDKRTWGPRFNELKKESLAAYEQRVQELFEQQRRAQQERLKCFDVTAYKPQTSKGSLHPFTTFIQSLESIFLSMGYEPADGPEVDTDYYNFTALNIPEHHPARDLFDTFWLTLPHLLLRTHTSNVQTHALETMKLPLALFIPGRCYRNEATDASHDIAFFQGEVMYVDKNVSLSNLLATAQQFLQAVFGKEDLAIRVRPGYFPFVEPGLEIDAQCPFCTAGCSTCKHSRWIELLGAGLIHPNVLKASNIDPQVYSGFAMGFGISRLAMIKYGITDVRLLHSNKLAFLNQF